MAILIDTSVWIIDCCIAQLAIDNDLVLFHNDRDFDTIAEVRPFKCRRIGV